MPRDYKASYEFVVSIDVVMLLEFCLCGFSPRNPHFVTAQETTPVILATFSCEFVRSEIVVVLQVANGSSKQIRFGFLQIVDNLAHSHCVIQLSRIRLGWDSQLSELTACGLEERIGG